MLPLLRLKMHSSFPFWNFEVDTSPPSAPSLISPSNGALTTDSTPYFDWGSVTDGVTYEIEVLASWMGEEKNPLDYSSGIL